jgi:oxalate decarboxylase/phosphoglucose isomerase-like protein (cupin superfamily)
MLRRRSEMPSDVSEQCPGDVSVVKRGHSHGIVNSGDGKMRLIVVGFQPAVD